MKEHFWGAGTRAVSGRWVLQHKVVPNASKIPPSFPTPLQNSRRPFRHLSGNSRRPARHSSWARVLPPSLEGVGTGGAAGCIEKKHPFFSANWQTEAAQNRTHASCRRLSEIRVVLPDTSPDTRVVLPEKPEPCRRLWAVGARAEQLVAFAKTSLHSGSWP